MTADPTASLRPIRTTAMGRPGGRIAAGALLIASSLAGGLVAETGSASAAGTTMTWSAPGTFPGQKVPTGACAITFTAVGADGGADFVGIHGGAGGEVTGTVAVTPGELYSVSVGGEGGPGILNFGAAGGAGGTGGGGAGGTAGGEYSGGGGGGSSSAVVGGQLVIVAAGGGGAGGAASPDGGTVSGGGGGAAGDPGMSGSQLGDVGGGGGAPGTSSGPGTGGAASPDYGTGVGSPGQGPNGTDPGLGGTGADSVGNQSGGGGGGGYNGGGGGGDSGEANIAGGGGGGSSFGPTGSDFTVPATVNGGNGQVIATFTACTAQTVTFTSTPASTTVGATYTPTTTASTTPITYAIDPATTNAACTLTAGVVTFAAAGNCIIDANAPAANGFAAGTATQTIAVTAAAGTGADLAVTLTAPATAGDGTTFAATLTVTDNGPNPAANLVTGLNIPAGVTAGNTSGARQIGPLLTWTAKTIPNGQNITYTITYTVGSRTHTTALLAAAAASLTTRDPHLANNAAATRIRLG